MKGTGSVQKLAFSLLHGVWPLLSLVLSIPAASSLRRAAAACCLNLMRGSCIAVTQMCLPSLPSLICLLEGELSPCMEQILPEFDSAMTMTKLHSPVYAQRRMQVSNLNVLASQAGKVFQASVALWL